MLSRDKPICIRIRSGDCLALLRCGYCSKCGVGMCVLPEIQTSRSLFILSLVISWQTSLEHVVTDSLLPSL